MNWFRQGPENPAPANPTPEDGPKPGNFKVRIDDLLSIHSAIQRGMSGELGSALLSNPLELVRVNLQSQGGEYNLYGIIDLSYESPILNPASIKSTEFFKAAARKYHKIREGSLLAESDRGYTITTPSGNKFIICDNPGGHDKVYVTTGLIKEYSADRFIQIIPGPKSGTPLDMEKVLKDFADILQITVEEVYKLSGKEVAEVELVLRGPKQPIVRLNSAGGPPAEGSSLQTTPDNLLGKLEIEKPNVSFDDIGGNEKAKREIEGLAFALKNPDLYKKWGTKPPKGIIIYGPSGTGKTLIAKALASQADAQFYHIEVSDIASKWYGESEQIVKGIFNLANQNSGKTIIFFDEIDAIAPQREGAHEVTQRVVSTLLENIDGLASNDNVMVVASTNRFDRWVEVPLPDEQGRRQIFDIHISKAQAAAGRKLFGDINLEEIIAKTEKTSGADIAEIIRRTLEEKVRQEGTTGKEPDLATTEGILKELEGYERVRNVKRKLGFITDNGK